MKAIIWQHCESEAERSDEEAKALYRERLENELAHRIQRPYCIPYVEDGRRHEWDWGKANKVVVDTEFSFYHHSKSELLEFSVENRGDADMHLYSMGNLYLDEFPAPLGSGSLYLVGANGHHRRLVFACIGFPVIYACVQRAPTTKWRYYRADYNRATLKFVHWFAEIGLITVPGPRENHELKDLEPQTIILEGPNNLAGWLLPDSRLKSLSAMLDEVESRAEALNARFGLDPKLMSLFRSRFRRRISLEVAYLKHVLRLRARAIYPALRLA